MAAMRNLRIGVLRHYQFPLKKNVAFDFGTTIGCVNNTFTFYCCSHKYQFLEAGGTDILKLDNIDESAAIFTT